MKNRASRTCLALIIALVFAVCFVCGCNGSYSSSYDWIINTITKYYYEDIPQDVLHKGIMNGGVSSVLDRYSAYYTRDEYAQVLASNSGSKTGIGVSYQYLDEGVSGRGSGVLLVDVVGGSPAWESGLKAGTFVHGVRFGGAQTLFNSTSDFSSFIAAREEGEPFTFLTDRGEYEVSKQSYTASYCAMATCEKTYGIYYESGAMAVFEKNEGLACLPEGAAYMRLDQFYGNAVEEFYTLMAKYNADNCTSLILDLRQNGGGYVDIMCDISGIFVGQRGAKAMTAEYKNGRQEFKIGRVAGAAQAFPAGSKMSVLADNGTASASEALIGVLISYGVIDYSDVYISDFSQSYLAFTGTESKNCRTYGKGIMQTTYTNRSTGEALKLTTAKLYWPNGACIHDVGLTAQKCRTVWTDWCVTYDDEQLARAIEMIYS